MQAPNLARQVLGRLGYANDLILDEYSVWTGAGQIVRADSVAFAASPADMSTATVVCQYGESRFDATISAARALATPILLSVIDNEFRLYSISSSGTGETAAMTNWVSAEDLRSVDALRHHAGPDGLLRIKRGEQQSLFPVDVELLAKANAAARGELYTRVESALDAISSGLHEDDGRVSLRRSSRLLVGGLTCLMIRDKTQVSVADSSLPDVALQRYPSYFSWYANAPQQEQELLQETISRLGESITYRGLSPRIVSDVYESVLVTEAERRELGVHYTPPELAQRILAALPIEEIDPERRVILDPTCGSGTLMLAAYDRAQSLLSESLTAADRHTQVSRRLYGWDADPFAVQITQLALLLHEMPQGNGWSVEVQDALASAGSGVKPTVVVANPPWLLGAGLDEGQRGERANQFLDLLVDRLEPGGLMAVVLPAGWLTSTYSTRAQALLRRRVDVFESWRLPENVFRSARIGAAVICARKMGSPEKSQNWFTYRRVFSDVGRLEEFNRSGVADEVLLLPREGPLVAGAITSAIGYAPEKYTRLDSIAAVGFGPQPETWLTAGESRGKPNQTWLQDGGKLPPFGQAPDSALTNVAYPDDFRYRMPVETATALKVLASATRWADNPWRLKVGIDLRGIVPRNSLFMIRPTLVPGNDVLLQLFAIMALLGSSIASAWVDEHASKRSARAEDLKSFPVPVDLDWVQLAEIGADLYRNSGDRTGLLAPLRMLEDFIWESYGLPEMTRAAVIDRLRQKPSPERVDRFGAVPRTRVPVPDSSDSLWTPGTVLRIEDGKIVMWVSGVTGDDGTALAIPPRFPGALCFEGATFEVRANYESDLPMAAYRFHALAYLEDQQLFSS